MGLLVGTKLANYIEIKGPFVKLNEIMGPFEKARENRALLPFLD